MEPPGDPGALDAAYGAITDVVSQLDAADFAIDTGCPGWAIDALLVHVMLDAERALMALAAPSDKTPDTDAVTYWQKYLDANPPDQTPGADDFAVRSAAAYTDPAWLVRHWRDLSEAAVAAASRADPMATITTQGHQIRTDDFIDTLVVEATIHHFDLVRELDADGPPVQTVTQTRRRLEQLLARPTPADWVDAHVVLLLSGRVEPTADELAALGDAATRLPVLR